jgi:hypothetical protein
MRKNPTFDGRVDGRFGYDARNSHPGGAQRGDDRQQAGMWSYISPEQRVPADHPLRPIRAMVDTILAELSPEFATLYSPVGRSSIPPEKLLRALLLQVLYSTRSEHRAGRGSAQRERPSGQVQVSHAEETAAVLPKYSR